MRSKILLLVLSSTIFLGGCFNAEEEKLKVENDIGPFYESLLFEDIDQTMNYFTLNSENYYVFYQDFIESFNLYNLLYEPIDSNFINVGKDSIQVEIKVRITGVGPEKEKIDREVIHHLEYRMNSEGIWKIYSFSEAPTSVSSDS